MLPSPNVLHRIGASQATAESGGPGKCNGVQLGVTGVGGGGNFSYILVGRIEAVIAGTAVDPKTGCPSMGSEYANAPFANVNGEVTAHETTHLWVRTQRFPTMDDQGHCTQERYQHDGLQCLMHKPYAGPGLFDGLVSLHYEGVHGDDSEYMWIRKEMDPVPQH